MSEALGFAFAFPALWWAGGCTPALRARSHTCAHTLTSRALSVPAQGKSQNLGVPPSPCEETQQLGQVMHPNTKNHPQTDCGGLLPLLSSSLPPSLVPLVAQLDPEVCLVAAGHGLHSRGRSSLTPGLLLSVSGLPSEVVPCWPWAQG